MTILRAKESFSYWDSEGVPMDIVAGTLLDPEKSPEAYKGRAHLFEDVALHVEKKGHVESATSEPGEKRTVTTPVRPYQRMSKKED